MRPKAVRISGIVGSSKVLCLMGGLRMEGRKRGM